MNGEGSFTATDDREGVCIGDSMSHGQGPPCVGINFKDTHRAVPQDGLGVLDRLIEELDGGWANVEGVPPFRNLLHGDNLGFCADLSTGCNHTVDREIKLDPS